MHRRGGARKIILLGLFIILMVALMRFTELGRLSAVSAHWTVRDLLAPVNGTAMNFGERLRDLASLPFRMVGAAEENSALKEKIGELESRLYVMEELSRENQRLKDMLEFKTETAPLLGYNLMTALVIGRDPGNWFGVISIDRGFVDGITADMTVINERGLVGRVISVSRNTANVLLITDPRSAVGALVQESRTSALAEGVASPPGQVRLVHIPVSAGVSEGQAVVTSGLASVYPKGVPIGLINTVGKGPAGLFYSAQINPFVDFNRLEEVMVITGTSRTDTGETTGPNRTSWGEKPAQKDQQDLAAEPSLTNGG